MRRRLLSMRQVEAVFQGFDAWGFDEKGWSPYTRKRYAARARAADRWLQANRGVPIFYAQPKDFKAYLFSTKANARNRNNVRQGLVAFGEYLVEQGFTEMNSALALPRLPEPRSLPRALDVNQGRRIAKTARALGAQIEALILLFLYAGLRRSEARLLEWRHVEGDAKWLRFEGKGQKTRVLPVHTTLRDALLRWRAECPDPQWVFPSPRLPGKPISETPMKEFVTRVGEIAGVPGLHPHTLRHTFATRLVEKDVHLREIQEALGHESPKTTTIYTRIRPVELKESIGKLDF